MKSIEIPFQIPPKKSLPFAKELGSLMEKKSSALDHSLLHRGHRSSVWKNPPSSRAKASPVAEDAPWGPFSSSFNIRKHLRPPQKAQKKVKKHDSIMFPSQDISSFRTATCNMSFSWLMARIPSISYQPFGHHPLKFPQPMHWSKARGTPWRPEPPWCDQDAGGCCTLW